MIQGDFCLLVGNGCCEIPLISLLGKYCFCRYSNYTSVVLSVWWIQLVQMTYYLVYPQWFWNIASEHWYTFVFNSLQKQQQNTFFRIMSCLKVQDILSYIATFFYFLFFVFFLLEITFKFSLIQFLLPGVTVAQPTPEHPHWKYWD